MLPISRINLFQIALTLLTLSSPAIAFNKVKDYKQGLDAGKLQQIQTISKSVLTAKRGVTIDPDMIQLKQRIEELRQTVAKLNNQMLQPVIGTVIIMAETSPTTKTKAPKSSEREQIENDVRKILNRVRQQRSVVWQKIQKMGEKRYQEEMTLSKVQELEDELENALQSHSNERIAKLRALDGRLTFKHSSQIEPEKDKTPTISTIVKHREE